MGFNLGNVMGAVSKQTNALKLKTQGFTGDAAKALGSGKLPTGGLDKTKLAGKLKEGKSEILGAVNTGKGIAKNAAGTVKGAIGDAKSAGKGLLSEGKGLVKGAVGEAKGAIGDVKSAIGGGKKAVSGVMAQLGKLF